MKRQLLVASILLSFLICCSDSDIGSNRTAEQGENYLKDMESHRKEKDEFMINSEKSPLLSENRANFKGLPYYPVNQDFLFKQKLIRSEETDTIQIATSKGKPRPAHIYGYFKLEIDGISFKLYAYRFLKSDHLFIPFKDKTNGTATYGGGRYIDFKIREDNIYEIDFNKAYNPYCAYNPKYDCPIPPLENHLPVEILAGEKYAGKH